jgi:ABC-2 type transport system ATP-binding protein
MIELCEVTKRYGATTAVDRLSVTIRPGHVTGFLGPNGAGKSTTLRMIVGLNALSGGSVTIDGTRFADRPRGLRHVGALLDAADVHPGRSAYAHLASLATSNRIRRDRVDEVLAEVGLATVARRRIGQFSLGMKQRLGIAAALLGDPPVLLFDEPFNGLDPEGVQWVRSLFRRLAADGRTVFVSSHFMSEIEHTADHLVVIGRGRLIADESLADFARRAGAAPIVVASPEADRLAQLLAGTGAQVARGADGLLTVGGLNAGAVGQIALSHQILLHELRTQQPSLEAAFLELTAATVDFTASPTEGETR